MIEELKKYISENKNKKIALFCDMDGTIVELEVDTNNDIPNNKSGYFLNKRPLTSIIELLKELNQNHNLDLFILSACGYREQAEEKNKWLDKFAPFFSLENRIYIIKEETNYDNNTKAGIKVSNIKVLINNNYDLAIYIEDEYKMLKEANKLLKDKVKCIHISSFIK